MDGIFGATARGDEDDVFEIKSSNSRGIVHALVA